MILPRKRSSETFWNAVVRPLSVPPWLNVTSGCLLAADEIVKHAPTTKTKKAMATDNLPASMQLCFALPCDK